MLWFLPFLNLNIYLFVVVKKKEFSLSPMEILKFPKFSKDLFVQFRCVSIYLLFVDTCTVCQNPKINEFLQVKVLVLTES